MEPESPKPHQPHNDPPNQSQSRYRSEPQLSEQRQASQQVCRRQPLRHGHRVPAQGERPGRQTSTRVSTEDEDWAEEHGKCSNKASCRSSAQERQRDEDRQPEVHEAERGGQSGPERGEGGQSEPQCQTQPEYRHGRGRKLRLQLQQHFDLLLCSPISLHPETNPKPEQTPPTKILAYSKRGCRLTEL